MPQESYLEANEDENYLKVAEVRHSPNYIEISCQLLGSLGLVWISNESTPALVNTSLWLPFIVSEFADDAPHRISADPLVNQSTNPD